MFGKYFWGTIFLFFIFLFGIAAFIFEYDLADYSSLEQYDTNNNNYSSVLDDEGNEFIRFQKDKREIITFDCLPNILIKAFVAAEDWNFFNHSGISLKGIARSICVNLYNGKIIQGASTITQQLAKLMFTSGQRTLWRKIQDIIFAIQMERYFTKEQILEIYLNNVYFGRGIYGVEAACRRFWNKSVRDVSIDEAAVLAAVAKSAYYYSPLNSPISSQKRRDLVLLNMLKLNFISKKEYDFSINKKLTVKDYISGGPIRLYLQEWIRSWSEKNWGSDILYKRGLKIKTTINVKMQEIAEKIFYEKIKAVREKLEKNINGGMISIDATEGKIKVLIGGFDFYESQFNRAFRAVRQMGSVFKPFLYTSALAAGYEMDNVLVDEPIQVETTPGKIWQPKNWTNRFDGPMTLVKALTVSNNIIAVKLFLVLGSDHVIKWAKNFGFKNNLQAYYSLALGVAESTVEQVAASFNVFANSGYYVHPYLIEWVKDCSGNRIWVNEKVKYKVLDSKINSKMINALSYRISLAKPANPNEQWIDAEAIGKTGSTNEATNTWFVGSTPELTTCIYAGRDDHKPMGKKIFASEITFPIWLDFNKNLKFKKKHFYTDPQLKEVAINWITGLPAQSSYDLDVVTILK